MYVALGVLGVTMTVKDVVPATPVSSVTVTVTG